MNRITFLRARVADALAEPTATSRRRDGTTAVEIADPSAADLDAAHGGGLLIAGGSPAAEDTATWVVGAADALELSDRGVPGWRITLSADGRREEVLDALARSGAAFLRSKRSTVGEAASLASLPGIATSVSVFVDDVEQALAAMGEGATDLVLRDWGAGRVGALRSRVDGTQLVERSLFPIGLEIDEARDQLSTGVFETWLNQVDGSGAVRPRYQWAPGKDQALPVPEHRFSAEWPDETWVDGHAPEGMSRAGPLAPILERSLDGHRPTVPELEQLFGARGDQVDAVAYVADRLRSEAVGDTVTYVVNRNINYTNLCYFKCGFCAFSKGPRSLNLREDPYLLTIPQVVERSVEAWHRGATEVCLQGGIHPEFTGEFYVTVVEAIKAALPDMHIHGFTPLEVWQGAETLGMPVRDFLLMLRDAGLGTLPGTAAEILDDEIRKVISPNKLRTDRWVEIIKAAHGIGLRSTSTLMYGHIEKPHHIAGHLDLIREIQKETGGFTEFVPLPFVHMEAPIYLKGRSRRGPTWREAVLIHAIARLVFDPVITNIQVSWVKMGAEGAVRCLSAGANDFGGSLMNESITRAAGAVHGQEMSPDRIEEIIRAAGRIPAQRTTHYGSAAGRESVRQDPDDILPISLRLVAAE